MLDTSIFLHAGEDVVFIANDWHTAPLACYLKTMYRLKGRYGNAKVRSLTQMPKLISVYRAQSFAHCHARLFSAFTT